MHNTARVDELWGDSVMAPVTPPYMETNKWLDPVIPTARAARALPEEEGFEFLGTRIIFTRDANGRFPQPVAECLLKLLEFNNLSEGWDSYGGIALQRAAVAPALKLMFMSHVKGCTPRLIPLPDGGVGLRWSSGAAELDIDVSGKGQIEGLLENTGDGGQVEVGPVTAPEDLAGLFDQYCDQR